MDRLVAMTVFAKVVEQGSFARAAERLGISTSAASRRVAELEAHLSARLLQRTTRRISLTESGQAFYERCVQLLADVEEAEAAAAASASVAKGTIRVTCSTHFGVRHLAPAIAAFLNEHPQLKFDVSLSERMVDLVEEGFDLAVRIGEPGGQNLVARKLWQTRIVACASPAYLARHGIPRTPEELVRHACLTYEYLAPRNHWRFRDRQGRDRAVRVAGPLQANNGGLLAAAAVQGIGICYEPDFIVAPELEAGRLRPLLEEFEPPVSDVHAVYPSRRHLSAKVRAFVQFLAARWGQAPAQPPRLQR